MLPRLQRSRQIRDVKMRVVVIPIDARCVVNELRVEEKRGRRIAWLRRSSVAFDEVTVNFVLKMAREMAVSWIDERIEQLITLFEDRPCLYNTKIRTYFSRDVRKKASEEIAVAMGLPGKEVHVHVCMMYTLILFTFFACIVDEVQKKLKCIHAQYTRERQKVKKRKSGDGADNVYSSKWVHFQHLTFLDDFITPKTSVSNYHKVCGITTKLLCSVKQTIYTTLLRVQYY